MLVKYKKIQPGKDIKLPVKLMFGMKAQTVVCIWIHSSRLMSNINPNMNSGVCLIYIYIYIRTYLYVYPHVCILELRDISSSSLHDHLSLHTIFDSRLKYSCFTEWFHTSVSSQSLQLEVYVLITSAILSSGYIPKQ
jgi:hypothetical protein